MQPLPHTSLKQTGFSMIEVLVSLIILLVGLLGLAGLMVQSQRSEMESYQRVQALIVLQDIAGRISANRVAATCYNFTTNPTGETPYLGTGSAAATIPNVAACAAAIQTLYPVATYLSETPTVVNTQATTAIADLQAWDNLLKGAAETSASGNVGAMVGARGCISYDPSTELPQLDTLTGLPTGLILAGTGVYTLSVAWQGMGDTFASVGLACGKNQYGTETRRRVVSLPFRIATLQ